MATFSRRRTTCVGTALAQTVGLGTPYALVEGFNALSSVDTSVSLAVVDADGKTICTLASSDYTNTTLKDGVEKRLHSEGPTTKGITEDGTDAVADKVSGGVLARSPLTVTAAGLDDAETLIVDFYVRNTIKKRSVRLTHPATATLLNLGAKYGKVHGVNLLSNADTSGTLVISDAETKVIFTNSAAVDWTNTTGKDGVEFWLSPEAGVTEDGTAFTVNEGGLGVWAMSPLSLLVGGIDTTEYVDVDVYVEV